MKFNMFLLASLFTILLSCNDTTSNTSYFNDSLSYATSDIIYFNDFENQQDIKDFDFMNGNGELSTDVSQDGGKSSLFISGGCIAPHISFSLAINEDMTIKSYALAKAEKLYCGGVSIRIKDTDNYISLLLGEENWSEVHADKTLDVKKGDVLEIEMISGGKGGCPSYLDNFTIERVK